jgi:predicted small lipoprotein YifL
MPVRLFILILLTIVAVAGCGRRGPLEEPLSASAVVDEDVVAPAGAGISPLDPGSSPPSEAGISPGGQQPAAAPRRRFLLDFLL